MRRIADLLAGGRLRVHVDSVFPFGEIARAHERLEGGGVRGKVVVAMGVTPVGAAGSCGRLPDDRGDDAPACGPIAEFAQVDPPATCPG